MADQIEQPKEPNLNPAQEAELRGLMPDYEPKGDDLKKEGGGKVAGSDKETVLMIATTATAFFGIIAARFGDIWALSSEEAMSLAVPGAALADKYFPGAKMGPEAGFVLAIGMVVIPRVILSIKTKGEGEGEVVKDGDKPEHATQQP